MSPGGWSGVGHCCECLMRSEHGGERGGRGLGGGGWLSRGIERLISCRQIPTAGTSGAYTNPFRSQFRKQLQIP